MFAVCWQIPCSPRASVKPVGCMSKGITAGRVLSQRWRKCIRRSGLARPTPAAGATSLSKGRVVSMGVKDRSGRLSILHLRRTLSIVLLIGVALLAVGRVVSFGSLLTLPKSCGTPVACETHLTGTPPAVWMVNGFGDPSIQGFATDISVNKGATIQFKINTPATGYS